MTIYISQRKMEKIVEDALNILCLLKFRITITKIN